MGWDSITNTMLIPRKHDYLQIPFYNRLGFNIMVETRRLYSEEHALFLLSTFTTDEKNKGRIRELEQEEGSPTQLIDLLLSLENKIVLILKQHFFPESDFFGFHFSPFTYIYHKEDLGFHSSAMGENPRLLLKVVRKAIQTRAVSAHGDDPESLFLWSLTHLILRITFHPVAFHQIFLHPLNSTILARLWWEWYDYKSTAAVFMLFENGTVNYIKMKEILGNDKDRDVLKIPMLNFTFTLTITMPAFLIEEDRKKSYLYFLAWPNEMGVKSGYEGSSPSTFFLLSNACLKEAFTIIILRVGRVNGSREPGSGTALKKHSKRVQSLKFSILSPNLSSSSSSRRLSI
ncbi:hypothetical protein ACJX0J_001635 (mitochondrion) [Zea mays]